jgi:hypothetical protein
MPKMTKQAWYIHNQPFSSERGMIKLTGRCKKTSGGPAGHCGDFEKPVQPAPDYHLVEVQKYLFGFKFGTYWISREYVRFFDIVTEEIYECSCSKDAPDA